MGLGKHICAEGAKKHLRRKMKTTQFPYQNISGVYRLTSTLLARKTTHTSEQLARSRYLANTLREEEIHIVQCEGFIAKDLRGRRGKIPITTHYLVHELIEGYFPKNAGTLEQQNRVKELFFQEIQKIVRKGVLPLGISQTIDVKVKKNTLESEPYAIWITNPLGLLYGDSDSLKIFAQYLKKYTLPTFSEQREMYTYATHLKKNRDLLKKDIQKL